MRKEFSDRDRRWEFGSDGSLMWLCHLCGMWNEKTSKTCVYCGDAILRLQNVEEQSKKCEIKINECFRRIARLEDDR